MKRLLLLVCCLTLVTSALAGENANTEQALPENDFPRVAANQLRPDDPLSANLIGDPWNNDPPCPDLDCSGGGWTEGACNCKRECPASQLSNCKLTSDSFKQCISRGPGRCDQCAKDCGGG